MANYVNPSSFYTGVLSGIVNQGSPAHLIGQSVSISKTSGGILTIAQIKNSLTTAWTIISGKITDDPDLKAEFAKVMDLIEDLISAQSTLFDYKGSVETVSALPTTEKIGACYNVRATGANYAWNGTEWDKLSETIDLSPYLTIASFNEILETLATKTSVTSIQEAIEVYKTEVNTQIAEILSSIETINGNITTLDSKIDAHIEDSKAHASKVSLSEEESARIAADEQLQTNLNTVESTLQGNIDTLSTALEDHMADAEAHLATKVELEDYYNKTSIDAKVAEINEDISDLTTNLTNEISAVDTKVDSVDNKLDLHTSNAEQTFATKVELADYYNKTEADNLLDTKTDKTTTSALSNKVDTIEGNLNSHITDAAQTYSTKAELDTYKNQMASTTTNLDSKITNVDTKLTQHVTDAVLHNATKDDITAVNTSITNLSTTLNDKIDSEVSALQTDINTKNTTLTTAISNEESARIAADSALEDILKDYVKDSTTAVFRYKGQVATQEDLPTEDMVIGDCYNIADSGFNFVWDGDSWDKLSETLDLSYLLTKSEFAQYQSDTATRLTNIEASIGTETANRVTGDNTIQANLDLVNSVLDAKINTEITNRETAYGTLNGKVDQEISDREAAISTVDAKVDQEISDRTSAITTLDGKVDTEIANRTSADTALDGKIDQEISDRESAIEGLDDKIDQEISDRGTAITEINSTIESLEDKLDTEIANRGTAEETLQGNINTISASLETEVSARESADTTLDGKIDAVDSKVDTLSNTIDGRLETIEGNIETINGNIETINGDIETINGSLESLGGDIDTKIEALSDEVDTKFESYYDKDAIDGKETTINGSISALDSKIDTHISTANTNLTTNYYTKSATDELLGVKANSADVEQSFSNLRAELNEEFNNMDTVIEGVQEELIKKANSTDVESLVEQEASDREAAISDLSESVDDKLELKADKSELANYYTTVQTDTKLNKKVDRELTGTNGKALIFNEEDGGGSKFETNDGRWSFAGVNDMGDVNRLGVQLYNIDRNNGNVGPRINLTADRATYSKERTIVTEDYELVVKKDIQSLDSDLRDLITDNYYDSETVDGLITAERTARESGDETLDDKIDAVKSELETDLESYYQKSETYNQAEIDEKDADTEKNILARIWSDENNPDDGYFKTKYDRANGSYAMIWNEEDGGGSQYFNKVANTISYVGTNEGGASAADVNVQIYSVDNTTKAGTRINVNPQGIFYVKGERGQGNTADREIAVKGDIASLSDSLDEALTLINGKLESIFHYKGSVATTNNLPKNNNEVGDVYNIESDGHNVAWNGSGWDKLSETIDLTPYLTTETFNTIIEDYYTKVDAHDKMMEISDAAELRVLTRLWTEVDIEDDTKGHFQVKNLQVASNGKAYYGTMDNDHEIAIKSDVASVAGDLSTLSATVSNINSTYVTQTALGTTIANYYNKEQSDLRYIQEHQDISGKAEQSDLTAEITNRTNGDNAIISKIWSNNNLNTGHFYTKLENNAGGYALVFNEEDGGGSQVFDKTDNVKSYVGVNLDEGNGAESSAVNVQIYSLDDTTKEGTRINVNTKGVFYIKGESGQGNPEGRELAVKADIEDLQQQIDEVDGSAVTNAEFAELQEEVDGKADISYVDTVDGKISAVVNQMLALEAKYNEVRLSNIEMVSVYDTDTNYFEDGEKDYIMSGQVEAELNLTAKSVTLRDMGINAAVVKSYTTGDFNMNGVEIDGEYDKSTMGNTLMAIHSDSYVTIRDCTITPEISYNGLEIGLTTGLAKGIIIDNVDFDGVFTNNAICIFGTADNAIITISNCHFHQVSNLLRISNRSNVRCTINLINCTCDTWETGTYAGPILCQDYTTNGEDNLFAPEKITINIQNLVGPNGKVVSGNAEDLFGTKDNNQICYVYANGFVDYDATKYPTIHIQ